MFVKEAFNNPNNIAAQAALKADFRSIASKNEMLDAKVSAAQIDVVTISPEARFAAKKAKEEESAKDKENNKERESENKQFEEEKIEKLNERDKEVRVHEMAHKAVGGIYAGAVVYEYTSGPDGKQYATGGYVQLDVSEEATPEETIRKAAVIRQAALAPADPSASDLAIAAKASQLEQGARRELAQQSQEASLKASKKVLSSAELKPAEVSVRVSNRPA